MPQWRYLTIDLTNFPPKVTDVDVLNNAGADGWELVRVTQHGTAYLRQQVDAPKPGGKTRRRPHNTG